MSCRLPFIMKIHSNPEYKDKITTLVGYFFPKGSVVFVPEAPHINTYKTNEVMGEEGYHLEITEQGICIGYRTYQGIRNALATVAMMATVSAQGFELPDVVMNDAPVLGHRGVMIDLARGIKPFETLVADLVLAAKAKLNYLHLHINDTEGVGIQFKTIPKGCQIPNCYSKEQMRHLLLLAKALGFEVIPEFDMPAHAKSLVSCVPEFGCDTMEENTRWTICPGTEAVYPFLEAVIKEIVELFPGRYLHIGGDELEFKDVPEIKQLCHWMTCRKCRMKMHQEGLKDQQELYYYFILRIYEMVKKNGKTMIMWSDQIDCDREKVLPDDIVMQFWRVAGEGRGPTKNCSMNAQLKMGYRVINSFWPYAYISSEGDMSADAIAGWRWDKGPECAQDLAQNVIGSEVCAWEYGNPVKPKYRHYERTFAPCIVIMGDKLWNGKELVFNEEYETKLTKAVLGPSTPCGLNIFQCFGSIIPPKGIECAYYDTIRCSKEEIQETLELLSTMKTFDYGSWMRMDAYQRALKTILEHLSQTDGTT